MRSRARSTALFPRTPVRRRTATSSASVRAAAPLASNRSRGRSSAAQLEMPMVGVSRRILIPLTAPSPMALTGSKILLGLTGGIAAYKSAELARRLVKAGADVRVAMTEAATRFITPLTMQALTGQPVWTDLWDARVPDGMGHIELSRDRDLIVVAPASADFLAKLANGLADDLLSTLCVARRCPMLVVPAMNVEMWQNGATQRNLEALRTDGVAFAG